MTSHFLIGSEVVSIGINSAFLNLWVVTPLGFVYEVPYTPGFLSDYYVPGTVQNT